MPVASLAAAQHALRPHRAARRLGGVWALGTDADADGGGGGGGDGRRGGARPYLRRALAAASCGILLRPSWNALCLLQAVVGVHGVRVRVGVRVGVGAAMTNTLLSRQNLIVSA